MNITLGQLKKSTKDLGKVVSLAHRKLFETETLTALLEIQNGKVNVFKNPKKFLSLFKK